MDVKLFICGWWTGDFGRTKLHNAIIVRGDCLNVDETDDVQTSNRDHGMTLIIF